MQKRPSLQSIRKNRQKEEFVGRDEQISHFRQNLTFDIEDERRKFIFNITGQGGIGKTTLLRRFSKLLRRRMLLPLGRTKPMKMYRQL